MCTVPDCNRKPYGRGYCRPHYMRWYRTGSPVLANDDAPGERWLPVTGVHERLDGLYEVSSEGRVRRASTGRVLAAGDSSGYRFVMLADGDVRLGRRVHRLVALAHVPNPCGYPVVRHVNGDRLDNRAGNLVWGTTADNNRDNVLAGKASGGSMQGSAHPNARLTEDHVRAIRADPRGTAEVARAYRVGRRTVWLIRSGRAWRHVT